MTINALNSGARVWLADIEDANTPHWANVVDAQVNLYDAVRRTIEYTSPEGKNYTLRQDRELATIVVRPRGWHLDERHILLDERPAVGALVDFGLYFFHNAAELLNRGSGPYFYLPKLESHLEARLWDDIFSFAENRLGIEHGSVRATVLIETIPAAFQMDEILYEMRDHISGLNAGRWDYLFSIIKNFRDAGPEFVLPDRASVTMTAPFMRAYAELLVKTCHARGAFAIGGMAAFIPSRSDAEVNGAHSTKCARTSVVRPTPGSTAPGWPTPTWSRSAEAIFDDVLGTRANQLDGQRPDVHTTAEQLLDVSSASGEVTEAGLRTNVEVSLRYLASWLEGNGAVGIHNLMEDAATAEISRSQIWQWVHNTTKLDDRRVVTADLVRQILDDELARLLTEPNGTRLADAGRLFAEVALAEEFAEFLTLPAYALID